MDVTEANKRAEMWQVREIKQDMESDRWGGERKKGKKEMDDEGREIVMEGEIVAGDGDGWKETGR